jgi:hypothetical protein
VPSFFPPSASQEAHSVIERVQNNMFGKDDPVGACVANEMRRQNMDTAILVSPAPPSFLPPSSSPPSSAPSFLPPVIPRPPH